MNIMRTKASWMDRRKARGLKPLFDAGFDPSQERDARGRWTDGLGYREDQRSDETFQRMRNTAFERDEKGLRGDSTATMGYRTPITIPVSLVADVPGRMDEKRVPGDFQYDELMKSVNEKGFTDETPIMVFVNPEGKPYINEGNTRVAVAKAKGVDRISAWIDWKNGSHQIDGPWNPDKIVPQAKPKVDWTGGVDSTRIRKMLSQKAEVRPQMFLGYGAARKLEENLPMFDQVLSPNTAWTFLRTPKGLATVSIKPMHDLGKKQRAELHWLLAVDRGAGRAAMEMINKVADKHGIVLEGDAVPLPPDTEGKKMSIDELVNWYKGFDFKTVGKPDKHGYSRIRRMPKKYVGDANPDPSGTEPLQKLFKKDMRRRWQDVRIALAEGLKTYDFTGVGDRVVPFQNWIDQVMASRVLGSGAWMRGYLKQAADLAEKRARGLVLDYDPDQPRDKYGQWTKTPGGDYVAFHGTMSRYLDSIQKEGLVIKNKNDRNFQKEFYEGERGEAIYVTDHLGRANEFASMLYDADPDRRMEYFGEEIKNPAVPIIIEAHIPAAEAAKLKEDQYVDNGYMFPNKIPPEWIKAYFTPDVPSMVMKKWERHHLRDGAGDKVLYFVILPKALTMDYDPDQPRDDHGRWMEGSKAVDETGRPLTVYRGTKDDIGERASPDGLIYFSRHAKVAAGAERGFISPEDLQEMGIDPSLATIPEGLRVYPAHLSIKNPVTIEDLKRIAPNEHSMRKALLMAKAAGYDGFMSDYEYVVFSPEQIRSTITNDADIDWMKTLQDHAVTELQGIMEAVSQQATRAMANGILARKNPTSDILAVITKIGEARGNMLISYSVMKTFSVATLEAYRAMGVESVGIIPEKVPHVHVGDAARKTAQPRGKGGKFRKFTKPLSRANRRKAEKQHIMLQELGRVNVLTAEDDRVCNTCEAIADAGPYTINKAMTLIPAHINCRCVFIPTKKLPILDFDPDQPRDERGRWTDFKFKPTGTLGKAEPAFGPPLSKEERDVLVNQELMRSEVPKGTGLKGFLEVMAGMAGSKPSVAKLLLEHGREYKADANTFAGPRGEPQMCYMNSSKMAIDDPSLTYVEGYVSVSGVPIAHAWLLDDEGNVVDPTIRTDLTVEDYFGIPFKTNYMMLSTMKNKYWGLLGDKSAKTLRPLLEGKERSFVRDGEFDMIMNPLSPEDAKWIMTKLVLKDYDPDQPRAPKGSENGGQWISQEGAPDSIGGGEVPKYHQPDQRVFEVGGDTWNKKMATQLELEYTAAKPALEEIEKGAIGQTVSGIFSAEDWDTVNPITQKKIENSWKIVALGDTYKQEVEAYWDSEAAQEDVAAHVLSSFHDGDSGFFEDVMEALRDGDEPSTFPFSDDTLEKALIVELKDNTKVTVDFDEKILNEHGGHLIDPNQMNLPGVEPQKPADFLTKEMRLELATMIKAKFNENVDEVFKTQSMDVPSWLNDSTTEIVDQAWDDMSDQEKYAIASKGNALSNENDGPRDKVVNDIPKKYDPTQAEPDSQNYRDTQVMARYMSVKRAQDLIKERLGKDESTQNIADWDNELWEAWKASSTSAFGIMMQLAIADEFQGRYRIDHLKDKIRTKDNETHEDAIRATARVFGENGYEKVKALLRAKWETTQWMLDKADMPKLNLYRGLTIDPKDIAMSQQQDVKLDNARYTKLPGVRVQRNGAASTSHSIAVANDWKLADANKITLRAVVPRTAIISVPAYGVNVHKERESVVMGTAWVGWDAWHGTAPDLDTYPLEEMIP